VQHTINWNGKLKGKAIVQSADNFQIQNKTNQWERGKSVYQAAYWTPAKSLHRPGE
jgi:hypothetical protein